MATRKEYIWDVKMILEQAGTTDESRMEEDYIGYKIDQKRAKEIRDTFKRNPVIEPIWLQDYGIFTLTPVNKVEDKTISVCDCKFSKAVLPTVVSITDNMSNISDLGTASIRSATGEHEFHYMNFQQLSMLHPDNMLSSFKYYTKVGNSIYLTPEVTKARAVLILENPLDGFVLDNTYVNSGDLVSGTTYEVGSGNIIYNSVRYYKGNTFVANSTATFTGTGKVQFNNQKRSMTNDDEYPMSATMAEVVLMKIFTQDYGIEARRAADIINNSQDDLKVLG